MTNRLPSIFVVLCLTVVTAFAATPDDLGREAIAVIQNKIDRALEIIRDKDLQNS